MLVPDKKTKQKTKTAYQQKTVDRILENIYRISDPVTNDDWI